MKAQTTFRSFFILITLMFMGLGLSSRTWARPFMPSWMILYGGDVLWAGALYGLLALFARRPHPLGTLRWTLAICLGVELTQLYQEAWASQLRSIPLIGYLLGHGFLWSDLVCYLLGSLAMNRVHEWMIRRARFDQRPK